MDLSCAESKLLRPGSWHYLVRVIDLPHVLLCVLKPGDHGVLTRHLHHGPIGWEGRFTHNNYCKSELWNSLILLCFSSNFHPFRAFSYRISWLTGFLSESSTSGLHSTTSGSSHAQRVAWWTRPGQYVPGIFIHCYIWKFWCKNLMKAKRKGKYCWHSA